MIDDEEDQGLKVQRRSLLLWYLWYIERDKELQQTVFLKLLFMSKSKKHDVATILKFQIPCRPTAPQSKRSTSSGAKSPRGRLVAILTLKNFISQIRGT